jgi:hypothetical protein
MRRICSNPGCGAQAQVAGECRTCYVYRRRTGAQRPHDLLVRYARRRFEARCIAELIRVALQRAPRGA